MKSLVHICKFKKKEIVEWKDNIQNVQKLIFANNLRTEPRTITVDAMQKLIFELVLN